MALELKYIHKDRPYGGAGVRPDTTGIDIVSGGCHVYGSVLTPEGRPGEAHPCAVMLHGYPGYTAMFDISQALRRTGVVAVNVFYRGCWGSEGYYSLPGLIDDAAAAAEWAVADEVVRTFGIDRNAVFFIGHSMGGFTAVNAARRLPWIRGVAALAPYDLPSFIERGDEEPMKELLAADAKVLRLRSRDSLYDGAADCFRSGYGFSHAYDDLKDRNVYFIGASLDDVAPPDMMIEPLWSRFAGHDTQAVQQYDIVDTDHGFNDMRLMVSAMIAQWMQRVLESP